MASFVNYQPTQPAENYTGRSKGIDVAGPDKSLGTLFEGIGKVVDTAVTTVDNKNILNINDELRTGIDNIRNAQGVQAAVTDPTVTGGETGAKVSPPPGVDTATSEIARINQAFKEGKIGDTYYYSKVESLSRQVRAKYPGYRDIIDQKVSSIIGTNPANALRSSLLSDLKAAQSTSQSRQNSDQAIVERGKEYLSPEEYKSFLENPSDPNVVNRLKVSIQQGELRKQVVGTEKANFELKKARGEDTQQEVTKLATKDSSDLVWKIISSGVDAGGGALNMESLNKRITEAAATGKPFSAEEIGTVRQGINALRTQASIELAKLHSSRWGKDGQYSYQSEVKDTGALERIKAQALAPLEAMEKALSDQNFGMFQYYANQSKQMKDESLNQLYTRSQAVRNLSAANEALGPALGQLLIESGVFAKAGSEVAKALNMDGLNRSVTGNDNGLNILKDNIKEARASKGSKAAQETATGEFNTATKILGSKTADPKAVANVAKTWFNENFNFITDKDILVPASRQKVLQMFSAPEIVDNLNRIKGQAPEAWGNYKSWLESSTKAVFNEQLSQLATWQKPNSGYTVTVDPQGRINLARDKTIKQDWSPGNLQNNEADRQIANMSKPIAQLNAALEARRKAAQLDGMNPNEAGLAYVKALGLAVPEKGAAKEGEAPLAQEEVAVSPASITSDDRNQLLQLEDVGGALDLDAVSARRANARFTSDPNWQSGGKNLQFSPDLTSALTGAAQELGVDREDLATVISYETGGTFDPSIRGGAGNRHIGLIQFGPNEQAMYGANQQQTVGEQMAAVVKYLKHRGFKKGMDILDLYSTINAGSPGRYNASDANNGGAPGTVLDKVNNQMASHRNKARRLFGPRE